VRWLGRDVDGAFAGRVTARRRWACPLDGALAEAAPGPEAAALPREAALAYALFARAGVAPGEVAIWLGDGPVAAFGVDIAGARGAHALVLTAEERGLAPDELLVAVRRRAEAAGQSGWGWKVFEVSGRAGWRRRALALAGGSGGLAALAAGSLVGVDEDEAMALAGLVDGEGTVVTVAAPHPDLVPELAAMAQKREIDLVARVRVARIADLEAEVAQMRRGQAPDSLLLIRPER
jgi:threonine dehydrogenase-like Zn-dependent dehydrogenase